MKIILAPLAATRGQQERLFWASLLLLLKLPLLRLLKCTFLSFIRKSYSWSQGAFVSTLLATRIYRINKDLTIYYNNGYVWSPLGPLFSVGIFPSSALARMPTFRLNLKSLFLWFARVPWFLANKDKEGQSTIQGRREKGPKIFILLSKLLLSVIFCTHYIVWLMFLQ